MPELTLLPFADRLLALSIAALISFLLIMPPGMQRFLLLDLPENFLMRLLLTLEKRLNRPLRSPGNLKIRGWVVSIAVTIAAVVIGLTISGLTIQGGYFVIPELLILVLVLALWRPCFALAELKSILITDEKDKVKKAREVVKHLSFTDISGFDHHALIRIAIESLALHFAGRVIATAFWYLIAGLPGVILCSLFLALSKRWQYPEKRYGNFGKAFRNMTFMLFILPERLAALIFSTASLFAPKTFPQTAFHALFSANNYPAPGANILAATAGALRVSLGGPRSFEGENVKLPWLDFGPARIEASALIKAQWLYGLSAGIFLTILIALNLLM